MSDQFAVIATGGKQYLVRPGATIKIEKLTGEPKSPVTFADVLLIAAGEDVTVGTPRIEGAAVTGTIVTHGRYDKVIGVKFRAKKRYRRKFGHRQHYTAVKIAEIKR